VGHRGWLVFLISGGITSLFIIDLCNAIYRCGCRSLWAGASRYCNIHMAGMKHCPWCTIGTSGFALILALILGPQLALSFWPSRWPFPARLAVATLAFPAAGALVAVVAGWLAGYWAR